MQGRANRTDPLQLEAQVEREEARRSQDEDRRWFQEQRQAVFESERFVIDALQVVTGACFSGSTGAVYCFAAKPPSSSLSNSWEITPVGRSLRSR